MDQLSLIGDTMWFPANYNTFSVYEDDPTRPYKLYRFVRTVAGKADKEYISQHYTLIQAMDAGQGSTKNEHTYIDTPEWTTWKHDPSTGGWIKL